MVFGKPLSFWKTLFQVLLEVWIRKNFLFSCLVVVDIVAPVGIHVLILNCRFFWSILELKLLKIEGVFPSSESPEIAYSPFTMFQVGSVSLSSAKVRNRFMVLKGQTPCHWISQRSGRPGQIRAVLQEPVPWASADLGVMVSDEFRHRWNTEVRKAMTRHFQSSIVDFNEATSSFFRCCLWIYLAACNLRYEVSRRKGAG